MNKFLFVALLATLLAAPAQAYDIPSYDVSQGLVIDYTNHTTSAARQMLSDRLVAFENETGVEFAI
ncbi:MAG: hypothetical protein ABIH41_07290, partial [Nanoarchaeota archaeon]